MSEGDTARLSTFHIVAFRKSFDNFEEFILAASADEIAARITAFRVV
jgi:hypothetical protein